MKSFSSFDEKKKETTFSLLFHNNYKILTCVFFFSYSIERGIDITKQYLNIMSEEVPASKFEFLFVAPFVTESTVNCTANSFSTRESCHVYTPDEIKLWREETKKNYIYNVQIGLTRDQGKRNYMEDRVEAKAWEPFPEILPGFKAAYIGVYDGHGGSVAVDLVLDQLRGIIMAEWRKELYGYYNIDIENIPKDRAVKSGTTERDQLEKLSLTILPGIIARSFATMQKILHDEWEKAGVSDGTTVVINILVYNKLFSAHVGDSRAILVRGGHGYAFTKDHKPNYPKERERIESLGGSVKKVGSVYRVDNNLSVARTLGDCPYKVCSNLLLFMFICSFNSLFYSLLFLLSLKFQL